MTITELKKKYNERILNLVASEIVVTGLRECLKHRDNAKGPLTEVVSECMDDVNGSSWDDIRSIIKRSL